MVEKLEFSKKTVTLIDNNIYLCLEDIAFVEFHSKVSDNIYDTLVYIKWFDNPICIMDNDKFEKGNQIIDAWKKVLNDY